MERAAQLLAIALLALPAASGAVTLNPISQNREVAIEIQVRTDTCWFPEYPPTVGCDDVWNPPTSTTLDDYADSESAPDFGPFVATAMDPNFSDTSTWQSSTISPTGLAASGIWQGFADGSMSFIGPPIQLLQVTEHHITENRYAVSFELSRAASFSLTGALSVVWGFGNNNASIELVGPGPTPVAGIELQVHRDCDWNVLNYVCRASLSQNGLLAPGVYTLSVFGRTTAQSYIVLHPETEGAFGNFDVEFLIAPPAVPVLPPGGAVFLGAALVAAVAAARRLPAHRGPERRPHASGEKGKETALEDTARRPFLA
jgi:hypothetical protein